MFLGVYTSASVVWGLLMFLAAVNNLDRIRSKTPHFANCDSFDLFPACLAIGFIPVIRALAIFAFILEGRDY